MARPPAAHPIQLQGIRLDTITTRRQAAQDGQRLEAYVPRPKVLALAEDGRSFTIEVKVKVSVPLPEDRVWRVTVTISAGFVANVDVDAETAKAFARASGLYLIWPYARSYLAQIAALADVPAPPLPLLSRPGQLTVEPVRRG